MNQEMTSHLPAALVVDLDGTLIASDLLLELWLAAIKRDPWNLLRSPFWLMRGRCFLKQRLAEKVELDWTLLPYRKAVVDLILEERSKSRPVILASASPQAAVQKIAEHLGYFDHFMGSETENLKGKAKRTQIERLLKGRPFRYVGDSWADLEIWNGSVGVVAINPSSGLIAKLKNVSQKSQIPLEVYKDQKDLESSLKLTIKALRCHQWAKNGLIALPMILGHFVTDLSRWKEVAIAFVSFSAASSTVYLLNDLLDLESDRKHATKKNRPFASGALPLSFGIAAIPFLLLASLLAAALLPQSFGLMIGAYLALNLLYSFYLKRILAIDVILLAGLYTLRILAGGVATDVAVSQWLLGFSTFFFFGLALAKRYIELLRQADRTTELHGRGYHPQDASSVFALGTAGSCLSVLILVLYLNSDTASRLYSRPQDLWLVAPCLLYWVCRVWILAHRKQIHDDPVVFALKDRATWLTLAAVGCVLYWAS
jgi:4-hydroxybenzoate polyprenyltransferase/phosphoserine phosphatase